MEDMTRGKIQEHEERIKVLEESDMDKERRLIEIEKGYSHLESTIMQENRDTRQFFQSTMDKQWDLIKVMGASKDKDKEREYEIQKSKMERRTEVFLKMCGAGGVIYLIVQAVISSLQ